MTYDEAVTVTKMVHDAFPNERDWNADQITMYAHGIERLDAELATRAVLQAQKTLARRPDVASLIAITRSISAGTAAAAPPPHKPKPMPPWVREWIYARFVKVPPDMRVFAQQREWADPEAPLMPPGEYTGPAARMSERELLAKVPL